MIPQQLEGEEYTLLFKGCDVDGIKSIVRTILKPIDLLMQDKTNRGGENRDPNITACASTNTPKNIKKKRPNKTTPPPTSFPPPSTLTPQQSSVLRLVLSSKSVFLTGPAGTGKSHVLRKIAAALSAREPGSVAVTSTTGTGACLVSGVTVHSFSGLGISTPSTVSEVSSILKGKPHVIKRWRKVKTLVIDEVSMMGKELLTAIDLAARWCRGSDKPMGGITCVMVGDFHQLPPVNSAGLCFECPSWRDMGLTNVMLNTNFRQGNDSVWRDLLNRVRTGDITEKDRKLLETRRIPEGEEPPVSGKVTELHPRVEKVREVNGRLIKEEAERRGCEIRVLLANDTGNKGLLKECRGLEELELCEGAEVILTKNINVGKGLANGTRGRIEGWTNDGLPVVRFKSSRKGGGEIVKSLGRERWEYKLGSRVVAAREQIPLLLGYAVSIHRSQGLTLPGVVCELGGAFGGGMVYTALSRVKELEGVWIRGGIGKVKGDERVKKFYADIEEENEAVL